MGLQFHSTPLQPSVCKPAMPAKRWLERSEWIGLPAAAGGAPNPAKRRRGGYLHTLDELLPNAVDAANIHDGNFSVLDIRKHFLR